MNRSDIIARITDKIQYLTGADPSSLVLDKPLMGQAHIDSLDTVEIAMLVEDEFGLGIGALEPSPDWTIDIIADAVVAKDGR